MTASSNANTSGLEVVAWRSTWVGLTGRTVHQLHQQEAEAIRSAKWMESATFEPLVTAASAQARIAELEALVASIRRAQRDVIRAEIEQEGYAPISDANDRAVAAEARADRLARSLEYIASLNCGYGPAETEAENNLGQCVAELQREARAALQQDTQP